MGAKRPQPTALDYIIDKGLKELSKRQANYTRTPGVVNFTLKSYIYSISSHHSYDLLRHQAYIILSL